MIAYIDMDGVLVDFFTPFANKFGYKNHKDIDPTHVVKYLDDLKNDPTFWHNLPRLSRAHELLRCVIKNFGGFSILSQPWDNDPNCVDGKLHWINENLIQKGFYPENIIFTKHKETLATSGKNKTSNILIDDFGPNIKKWCNAGGIGIKHKNHKFERTLKNILEIL